MRARSKTTFFDIKMWVTFLIALDIFLAWYLTHLILSPFAPVFQYAQYVLSCALPAELVQIILLAPNVLLVALYYMLPRLSKNDAFKNLQVWSYFRRNFQVEHVHRKVKSGEQVIYAVCPHGMHGEAAILHFVLNPLYNHVVPVATSLLFYIPIVREFASLAGAVPANSADISCLLDHGESVLLLPEGLRSVLYAEQDLRVLKGETNGDSAPRKGFIRVARTSKNHKTLKIVPVWMHGVDSMYTVYRPLVWLQRLVLRTYRYPWPIVDFGNALGFWPRTDEQITVYFGKPIAVGTREVDDVFAEFVESIEYLRAKGLADNRNSAQSPP
jgi:1-acyl-sn-glycerol-3-phosphate acyltransferase